MNKNFITLSFGLIISLYLIGCNPDKKQNKTTVAMKAELIADLDAVSNMDVLKDIQNKINTAYSMSFTKNNVDDLLVLYYDIEEITHPNAKHIATYWMAYIKYDISLVQFFKLKEKDKAKNNIDEALRLLSSEEQLDSEYYSLLSVIRGFSTQFYTLSEVREISKKLKEEAEESIRLDTANIRGHFALASADFYVPEMYGGGKLVEPSLLYAIENPDQSVKNEYLPSWGKDLSYNMLIQYYIRKDRNNDALSYLEKFKAEFPDSYYVKALSSKLKTQSK